MLPAARGCKCHATEGVGDHPNEKVTGTKGLGGGTGFSGVAVGHVLVLGGGLFIFKVIDAGPFIFLA